MPPLEERLCDEIDRPVRNARVDVHKTTADGEVVAQAYSDLDGRISVEVPNGIYWLYIVTQDGQHVQKRVRVWGPEIDRSNPEYKRTVVQRKTR